MWFQWTVNGQLLVNVRFVHHPITETAQHWDHSKLLLEWKSIELFEHLFRVAVLVIRVVEHQTLVDHIQAADTPCRGACQ